MRKHFPGDVIKLEFIGEQPRLLGGALRRESAKGLRCSALQAARAA
jgi:hypothetical protein